MLTLRPHQLKAVELARTQRNLALLMEAGVGKTAAIARILAEDYNAHGRIRKTLIFAPITVCKQWPLEIDKFTRIPQEKIHVLTCVGKKRSELMGKLVDDACIVVTNYEGVQIKDFYEKVLKFSPEILVLDESHRIKDSKSKRAKAIFPLCQAANRRFILTGTPTPNSLFDIFSQYKALDASILGTSAWNFRVEHFYDRNAGRGLQWKEWVPYEWAAKAIGQKIKQTSVQVTRAECLSLPPLTIIPIACDMSVQQAKCYEEMKKQFVTEVKSLIMSSQFEMVKTMRMQQILTGFIQPDEKEDPVWFDENPRLDALMDIIDSLGKEKVIVWTVFRPTYKRIGDRLEKAGLAHTFLTGEQRTDDEKQTNKAKFISGDAQVLIANPAAAGEGIDGLQVAKYAIYYTRSYSYLHYEQSLARNYRGGSEQHDKVVHYHLLVKGTIDEVITDALIRKESVQEKVLAWARSNNISLALDKDICNEEPKEK